MSNRSDDLVALPVTADPAASECSDASATAQAPGGESAHKPRLLAKLLPAGPPSRGVVGMLTELTEEQVVYYRQVLVTHAIDSGSGVCQVCCVLRCADWVDAFDHLAAAKQLMVVPDWQPAPERR